MVNTHKSNRTHVSTLACVHARGHAHPRPNRIEGIELKDNWCCTQRSVCDDKTKEIQKLLSRSKLLLIPGA